MSAAAPPATGPPASSKDPTADPLTADPPTDPKETNHQPDHDDQTDPPPSELKLDGDIPELDESGKAVVNNLYVSVGAVMPKKGTEEYRLHTANLVQNSLSCASLWTGNKIENVACCVSVESIRRYDLQANHYKVPSYKNLGNSLPTQLLAYARRGFDAHNAKEREAHKGGTSAGPNSYQEADWTRISSLIMTGIRYYCQHWNLNPGLSLEANYNQAYKVLMERSRHPTIKHHQIITALASEKYVDDVVAALANLETEEVDGKTVFTEKSDEDAEEVIGHYLKAVKFSFKKTDHPVHMITALQAYITSLPDGANKDAMKCFLTTHPRDTQHYREKVAEVEERKKKKAEYDAKLPERELKRKIAQAKKHQQRLVAQQEALKKAEATTAGTTTGTAATTTMTTRTRNKKRMAAVEASTTEEATEIQSFLGLTLPQLKVKEFSATYNVDASDLDKPVKSIKAIDVETSSKTLAYVYPGNKFCAGLKKGINAVCAFIDALDETEPQVIADVMEKADSLVSKSGSVWLPSPAVVTTVAIFLDTADELTIGTDKAGNTVAEAVEVPLLASSQQETEFSNDVQAIASSFLLSSKAKA